MTGTQRIVTPVISTPESQRVIPFLATAYHVRLSGRDTAGTFALLDTRGTRGHGSPMHLHRHDSETFLVLEGTLKVVVDGQEHEAGPGDAAVLPAGLPHGFVVTSDEARYIGLHHGPGFEEFIAAAEEGADLKEVAAAHGIDILGPPPTP